jgi:hypothetical protein
MDQVGALEPRLRLVADLNAPMRDLGTLRDPLERVAALGEPMQRVAALGSIFNRPGLLIGLAILGLAAWGGVTFLAVRLAIISAARATAPR